MKQQIHLQTKKTPLIQLKTAYLYGASFVVLANIMGAILSLSLDISTPESASATTKNSYLEVVSFDAAKQQFIADHLTGSISDFQPGKTIMICRSSAESISTASTSMAESAPSDEKIWEPVTVSSISGTGPYIIMVSSVSDDYSDSNQKISLVSVPK